MLRFCVRNIPVTSRYECAPDACFMADIIQFLMGRMMTNILDTRNRRQTAVGESQHYICAGRTVCVTHVYETHFISFEK